MMERPKARERQEASRIKDGAPPGGENFSPPSTRGRVRDIVTGAVPAGLFIRDGEHARKVAAWAKRHPQDPRVPALMDELVAFDWRDHADPPASDHARLEVAAAWWRGRKEGRPVPLDPGQPVPGCRCERCTGMAPVKATDGQNDRRPAAADYPPLDVDAARAVPILDVAARLGIEHRRGWALCPFHADSSPSFHLNAKKGAAFCNPCGRSWDAIALVMELRGVSFMDAVRELT